MPVEDRVQIVEGDGSTRRVSEVIGEREGPVSREDYDKLKEENEALRAELEKVKEEWKVYCEEAEAWKNQLVAETEERVRKLNADLLQEQNFNNFAFDMVLNDQDKRTALRAKLDESQRIVKLLQSNSNRHSQRPSCGVCMREFCTGPRSTPRILPCGHSLCEYCILGIMGDADVITCPFDRVPIPIPNRDINELPKNYSLTSMSRS